MKRALLSIPLLVLLVGCGNPEAKVVGKWKFQDLKFSKPNAMEKFAKQMLSNVTYELKADHTYVTAGIAQTAGTWKLEGEKITLQTTMISGRTIAEVKEQLQKTPDPQAKAQAQNIDKPSTGTLSTDGKQITIESSTGMGSLILSKEASAQ